jgi:hypothetical protein
MNELESLQLSQLVSTVSSISKEVNDIKCALVGTLNSTEENTGLITKVHQLEYNARVTNIEVKEMKDNNLLLKGQLQGGRIVASFIGGLIVLVVGWVVEFFKKK